MPAIREPQISLHILPLPSKSFTDCLPARFLTLTLFHTVLLDQHNLMDERVTEGRESQNEQNFSFLLAFVFPATAETLSSTLFCWREPFSLIPFNPIFLALAISGIVTVMIPLALAIYIFLSRNRHKYRFHQTSLSLSLSHVHICLWRGLTLHQSGSGWRVSACSVA